MNVRVFVALLVTSMALTFIAACGGNSKDELLMSPLATLVWHGEGSETDSEFSVLELPADGRLLFLYDRSNTNATLPWLKAEGNCLPIRSSVFGDDFQSSWNQIVSFVNDSPLQSAADAEAAMADAYGADDVESVTENSWSLMAGGISSRTFDALADEQRAALRPGALEALQTLRFSVFPAETIDADSKAGELLRYLRDGGSQRLRAQVERTKPECIVDAAR